jgi:hypothetical protein
MDSPNNQGIIVTDIKMPFWSMVTFMMKWTIASIPAFIILLCISTGAGLILGAIIGGTAGIFR